MNKFFFSFLLLAVPLLSKVAPPPETSNEKPFLPLVEEVVQLKIPGFPDAFNPSIARFKEKIYVSFRWQPDRIVNPWISYVGLVQLNEELEIISKPVLINTRGRLHTYPLSEDARLFATEEKLYLVYNDSIKPGHPRRDMYFGEIVFRKERARLINVRKLTHENDYSSNPVQKNWSPFTYLDTLLFTYSLTPHEILYPQEKTGLCKTFASSKTPKKCWTFGHMRGGTPAEPIGTHYLSFFHSSQLRKSPFSPLEEKWHYYMGAYLFSATPPFEVTHVTPAPITHETFYEELGQEKFVIFPGGFFIDEERIVVAYGKDDEECWLALLSKKALYDSLAPVTP